MAHRLADETLAAILSDSLSVLDTDFASTNSCKSPFATEALSSSTILLVCKRWLRVATPLLYETVILRSSAQSSALAGVLKKQTEFGRYIRKVRVEGGVGASICKIFKAAPNITDLCLTLDLYADDNATSMYKSLFDSVTPRRLVLCSAAHRFLSVNNKMITTAIESLATCIRNWTSLHVVTLAVAVLKEPRIYKAVCAAPDLELVHLPERRCTDFEPRRFLSQLAERCSAPVIRVGWPDSDSLHRIFLQQQTPVQVLSPAAQAKVQFAEPEPEKKELVFATPSTVSSYTPLSTVPESTRRLIWTRILDLVISHTRGIDIPRARDALSLNGNDVDAAADIIALLPRGPVLQCMSVCKEWKEIVVPLACRDLCFHTMETANSFLEWMKTRKDAVDLLDAVRSLRLTSMREGRSQELAMLSAGSFLSDFRNLERFLGGGVFISPKVLRALPTAHLQTLAIKSNRGTYELPSFPSLRALDWNMDAIYGTSVHIPANEHCPSMPSLETLVVSGPGAPDILAALSAFSMPAVRSLTFDENVCASESELRLFCSAHGASIRTVINQGESDMLRTLLPNCPGLVMLSIHNVNLSTLAKEVRRHKSRHSSLEKIDCPYIRVGERYTKSKAREREMLLVTEFCDALDPESFPALRTLRVPNQKLWPATQRDIDNHPLPALAEKMLERGIRIVDHSGVGWKPRLTRAKRK